MRTLCAGMVVVFMLWGHAASAQVNLPPGFEIVEFAVNDYGCTNADINDCGQIAFAQYQGSNGHSEIFVYDNGLIAQITNGDDRNVYPYINNSGQMVWGRGIDRATVTQLILYDQGQETLLEEYPNAPGGWSINDQSQVCFARKISSRCPRQANLFLWDGSTTSQLTFDAELSNVDPSLNDHGEIAWMNAQFCENPWHSEIFFRTADGDLVLPAPTTQNQGQELANSGEVVWDSQRKITLWTGGQTRLVTDLGSVPHLNSSGRIYVSVWDPDGREAWQAWIFDIDGGAMQSYRLVDNDYWYTRGAANEWGETAVEWAEDPPNSKNRGGVFFLRRIRTGDSEFDHDVDLRDHKRIVRAMTGPVRTEGLCEDRFLDINYDGDLDMGDYARFQNAFTGASP